MVTQSVASYVDPASAIASMWAKVGVELQLDPRDYAVWSSLRTAHTFDEMLMDAGLAIATVGNWPNLRGFSFANPSSINDPPGSDPTIEAAYQETQKYLFVNDAKVQQIIHDVTPYILEQAFVVPRPSPYLYDFWWPWVKNYHGEQGPIYSSNLITWTPYVWIDQDLKAQMTGKR
jgi:ABC-type transport system substrate-binding protein